MERIMGKQDELGRLARRTMYWIFYSKRLLTKREIQHALATEVGTSYLDEEHIATIATIVSACGGLVVADQESDIIRLVHYTTQDYLYRTHEQWFPNAMAEITDACATYLSFSTFETGECGSDLTLSQRQNSNPFYTYASKEWGNHARQANVHSQVVNSFLLDHRKVEAASQAMQDPDTERFRTGYKWRTGTTGLHLAAFFGIESAIQAIIDNYDLESRDSLGWTPLHFAAKHNRLACVKILVKQGASVDSVTECLETPLSMATEYSHLSIVDFLLKSGTDVNKKCTDDERALSIASRKGNVDIVERLLAGGAEVNAKDRFGNTSLRIAADLDYMDIVKRLLEHGAEVNVRCSFEDTPLKVAADRGHTSVVKLLLESGADPNVENFSNLTPLKLAVYHGFDPIVKLLVEHGADLGFRGSHGESPLSLAYLVGDSTTAEFLLDHGADPDV